jgi:spermidine/putrescine-binding protein
MCRFSEAHGAPARCTKQPYFSDNQPLLARLEAGARGLDVVVPSDYIVVTALAKRGLLQLLHMDLIPNFANVGPRWQRASCDSGADGKKYSTPHDWGTTGIDVRKRMITQPITKWAKLWNPGYTQKIQMMSDERELIGAVLKMLGCSLKAPNSREIDQATRKALEQKKLVKAYNPNTTKRALVGGTPLVRGWDRAARQAYLDIKSDRLTYILPEERQAIFSDDSTPCRLTRSARTAHLFMNLMLGPKINAESSMNGMVHGQPRAFVGMRVR